MAFAFAKRIDVDGWTTIYTGDPVIDGTTMYLVYSAFDQSSLTSRVYFVKVNLTTLVVTAKVDVSGALPAGAHSPGIVKMADGRLICGYNAAPPTASQDTGFYAKESTDDGATWGSLFTSNVTFPLSNQGFLQIHVDPSSDTVRMLSKNAIGKIVLWKRTGAGTWTYQVVYQQSTINYASMRTTPCRAMVIAGPQACVIGDRAPSAAYDRITAFVTSNLLDAVPVWTERTARIYPGTNYRRYPQLWLDLIKVLHACWIDVEPGGSGRFGPRFAYSRDFGITWHEEETYGAFVRDEAYPAGGDNVGIAVDGRNRPFISDWDSVMTSGKNVVLYRGTPTEPLDVNYDSTTEITDGVNTMSARGPSIAAVFAPSGDYLRLQLSVVSSQMQLWLLKYASLGSPPGGPPAPGGGGDPRYWPD